MANPFKKALRWAGDQAFGAGRGPFHENKNPPLVRPPASGPSGATPGRVFPIGPRSTGGNIPNTPIPPVGVNVPSSGGSMAGDGGGSDWKGWLADHWDDLVKLGIGAFTTKEALENAAQSNALMQEGLGMAREDYAGRAKFRDAASAKLLNPQRPDLSSLFADPGNPYTRGRSLPVVGSGIPTMDLPPNAPPLGNPPPINVVPPRPPHRLPSVGRRAVPG